MICGVRKGTQHNHNHRGRPGGGANSAMQCIGKGRDVYSRPASKSMSERNNCFGLSTFGDRGLDRKASIPYLNIATTTLDRSKSAPHFLVGVFDISGIFDIVVDRL